MVKLTRSTKYAALAASGALILAACGSDPAPESTNAAPSNIDCATGKLSTEGSSAQANAMAEWIKSYQEACGEDVTINYNATGSGAGVQQFLAGQADFAGSDSALNSGEMKKAEERCDSNEAWNLPMVVGPVAIAFNVTGLEDLVLDAETTAKIFSGAIKKWDDAGIKALNPDADLPPEDIVVFFRSDDSGTTDNFTKYLNAAAPKVWTKEHAKTWSGIGEGKPQSAGVQQATLSTDYSISYMEWSFAKDAGLGVAKIDNGSDAPVELSAESAGKALESAEVVGKGKDLTMELDYTTDAAATYPIVLVTYEVVCSGGQSKETSKLVKSFLTYTSGEGQSLLEPIGYGPLPGPVQEKVAASIEAIS